MRRASFLILVVLVLPGTALGQAASPDSQTLQDLLTEVRGLRQDLHASLARVERAQILLSRLQTQQAAVTRASDRLDDMRSRLADVQTNEKQLATNLARVQDALGAEQDPAHRKELEGALEQLKREAEASSTEEQQRQAAEVDAEQQLRLEQDKLSTLEGQLDALVRSLASAAEQSGRVPR
ncbi:MAG TPA: hypothetical protein VLY23_18975 [Candidatus Acidoferrum sp.]|nr:hypothetical protein [Candidatus Acidoferrum sp.]